MESAISSVAAAMIVGLRLSRTPLHMRRGIVCCSGPARKRAMTTSSHEVAKAKIAPDTTPGRMSGSMITRNTRAGLAPRIAPAFRRVSSKDASVAATVRKTNGAPSAAWARMSPV